MTLRKLSAAVLASVVASGAMAQTDTDETLISITVAETQAIFAEPTIDALTATEIDQIRESYRRRPSHC